jgi:hypothetical protein
MEMEFETPLQRCNVRAIPGLLARLGLVGLLTVILPVVSQAEIDLSPRNRAGDLVQVRIELEVGGHLTVRDNDPAADKSTDDGKSAEDGPQKLPLSVHADLQYDEWHLPTALAAPWTAEVESPRLAMRHYDQADAVIKVDDGGHQPRLPEDRRLLVVRAADSSGAQFWCPAGRLERDEFDLIDVVGNSLVLDRLLPADPIDESESWNQDENTMAAVLGLDSLAVCEVQSVIDKVNKRYAQVRMAGVVHGAIDGAATEIELEAVYLFDRQDRRMTQFNLALKEKRSVGDATPGLDVVAKLKLTAKPLKKSAKLSPSSVAAIQATGSRFDNSLRFGGKSQGIRFDYDPGWFVTSEGRKAVTLRRIDDGQLVAHCTTTRLPEKSAERATTLEEFQKDVQFSLRDNFGQFVRSKEWTNAQGHRCFGVVANGTVEEVPVEWRYYLIASEKGERASLAFTAAANMAERLGNEDRELADQLEFTEPTHEEPPAVAAIGPSESATAERAEPATVVESKPQPQRRQRTARRMSRRPGGVRGR